MASVCASGSPSLTSAAAFHTQLLSLPTLGVSFMSGTTAVTVNLIELSEAESWGLTVVVGADFQGLVSSHDQAGLVVLFVLQQSDISGSTLLPLVGILDELEELRAHLEDLVLEFLIGLDLDLLGETDHGLEVDILRFWHLVL